MQTDTNLTADDPVQPGLSLWNWLITNSEALLMWFAVGFGLFLVLRLIRAIAAGAFKTDTPDVYSIRNVISRLITGTQQIYLLVLSLSVTAPFFINFPGDRADLLPTMLTILTIIQMVIWIRILALGIVDGVLQRTAATDRDAASLRSLIGLILNIALIAIAAVMILSNLGINATGLMAGLGVGGIAIGLAAQSLFEDLFAGVSILLDRPFVRGDFISFGGFSGTVEKVGLKSTRLVALGGERLSLTNAKLLSNEIQNFKLMRERRATFSVGVTYQTPHEKLKALPEQIKTIVSSRMKCRFDRCHLSTYGDSAVLFDCVYYVTVPGYADYMDEQQAILLGIHALFEREGLEFAYPTQTVFVEKTA